MNTAVDVLVVGAGPVGLLNALGLAKMGLKVKVLEKGSVIEQSPRAAVYHWSVLDGLDQLGLVEEAKSTGFAKQDYSYLIYDTGERIDFDIKILEGRTKHPYNIHLGQHQLAEIALRHLQTLGAEVLFDQEVVELTQEDSGVELTTKTPDGFVTHRGSWVIGSDGARSSVRKLVGYSFDGITWPERFVATNIRYDFEAHGYRRSNMQVHHTYGAIIARLDDSNLWRCTYCEDRSLPEETVAERMPEIFSRLLPGDGEYELIEYSPYKMHQRAATSMRAGRVLFAGDAAHATNPTGGLGLTSGLFDTYLLYPTLSAVVKGQAEDHLLDQYAKERKRIFTEIVNPAATENKRFVYHSSDPERLEEDLKKIRKLSHDEEAQLERVMGVKKLESAPLVEHSLSS